MVYFQSSMFNLCLRVQRYGFFYRRAILTFRYLEPPPPLRPQWSLPPLLFPVLRGQKPKGGGVDEEKKRAQHAWSHAALLLSNKAYTPYLLPSDFSPLQNGRGKGEQKT